MEKSPIIDVIKKTLPGVVSIASNKYIPRKEDNSQFWGFLEDEQTPINFSMPLKKKKIKVGGGSGFIIDAQGIILTNRHVVSDPEAEYSVILNDGKKFKTQIIVQDQIQDIAILKIEPSKFFDEKFKQIKIEKFPTIELGESSNLQLGQTTIAIGDALGEFQNTISVGVISGLSRFITAQSSISGKISRLRGLIQTDAAINPGNSGGPLIDIEGKVIGVNIAYVSDAENIGFALPINATKKSLEDFKKYGKLNQPYLGIRYLILNKDLRTKNKLPVDYGALVISEDLPTDKAIIPGSPAQKAGIKEFDIILECQGQKITEENLLEDIIQKFKIGDEICLKILRNNKEKLIKINLENKN